MKRTFIVAGLVVAFGLLGGTGTAAAVGPQGDCEITTEGRYWKAFLIPSPNCGGDGGKPVLTESGTNEYPQCSIISTEGKDEKIHVPPGCPEP